MAHSLEGTKGPHKSDVAAVNASIRNFSSTQASCFGKEMPSFKGEQEGQQG